MSAVAVTSITGGRRLITSIGDYHHSQGLDVCAIK